MKITYKNIANFSLGDACNLFQFFVEYKEGEDPFGVYLPQDECFFTEHNIIDWLEDLVLKECNKNFIGDLSKQNSNIKIQKETFVTVIKTMFYFKESQTKIIDLDKLEEKWLKMLEEDFNKPLHDEFALFFQDNNYENYLSFILDLESHIQTYNPNIDIKEIIDEILVLELFMKNIGRKYMTSTIFLGGDSLDHLVQCKYDEYFEPIWSPENLSLTTHFSYENISLGNYKITLNWSWCMNHVINSNVEKEFNDVEIINVKMCDLLRYSQNYINMKRGVKNHYFNDYRHLYEGVIPVVPNFFHFTTQQSIFLSEQNKILGQESNKEENISYSPYYLFLKDKFNLSRKFLNYNYSLYDENYFEIDNIYQSTALIHLPYWEIPRIQLVTYKHFVLTENAKYWEKRMQQDDLYSSQDEYYSPDEYDENEDFSDNLTDEEYKEILKDLHDIPIKPDEDDDINTKDLLDPYDGIFY